MLALGSSALVQATNKLMQPLCLQRCLHPDFPQLQGLQDMLSRQAQAQTASMVEDEARKSYMYIFIRLECLLEQVQIMLCLICA